MMHTYEYKFIEVPIVSEKKGWRLKQVVFPFNEKVNVYTADCYQSIFEKEFV